MNAVSQRLTFARGFTLVELALVLLIVAILIGGLLIPLSTQMEVRNVAASPSARR
jgi:prepilin-type N-terminal cleavage/methylation domain-containing protein